MTWLEEASEGHAVKLAIYDGKSWSKPSTIISSNKLFVNWADFPSLVVLKNGTLAAQWLQKSGDGKYAYDVMISTSSDNGKKWSSPVRPYRDETKGEHGFVSLIPNSESFEIIWLDSRKFELKNDHSMKNEMQLMTSVYSNGSFQSENVLDARVCDCCQTDAAVVNGDPVVVYRDRSSSEVRDISLVRRDGNQWSQPMVLHQDNWKIAACPVNGPAISASGKNVVVAWFTAAQDKPRVYAIFSSDGGKSFGRPIQIDTGNPVGRVDVQWLSDRNALVSWLENKEGSGAAIMVRRVKPEGAQTPVVIAPSSAARASGFPRMAAWGDGAVIAWTHVGENTTTINLSKVE
ncbi:glycoside hydrolase [bacterium]|nr:glycoside hydrolase [bacterium]